MADIIINEEQQSKIIGIVDKYLELHKRLNDPYCIDSTKMYDSNGKMICNEDCNKCKAKHYSNIRVNILNSIGLGEYNNEEK